MKRSEAEIDMRRVDRRCRGPWLLSLADQQVLREKWQAIVATNNVRNAAVFVLALEKTLSVPTAMASTASNDSWAQLSRRSAELIFACKENCGYDVNDLICQHPFDGVEREAACPKCGQTHTFSTFYEVTESEA
jgi:hypothetical protein